MKRFILVLVCLVIPFVVNSAQINIGEFSGSETLIDFNGLSANPATGAFSIGNVTFSEASTGSGSSGWRNLTLWDGATLTDNAGVSNFTLDFLTPVTRAGLDIGIGAATYSVSFFDATYSLLGSVDVDILSGDYSHSFVGWEDLAGISRLTILESTADNYHVAGIDNVRYEGSPIPGGTAVPEPATFILLGSGLVGLAFYRRKKK